MVFILWFLCGAAMVTGVPLSPNVQNPLLLHKGNPPRGQNVEATNQKAEAQMADPLSPTLDQTHPGTPQQPDLQTSLQQYAMLAQGGGPVIFSLPQSVYPSLPGNQLTLAQQPLIFPAYGFMPLFPSPTSNQMFSPFGFPMVPQTPTQQLPNSPVSPVETAAVAAGPVAAAGPAAAAGSAVASPQQIQNQNPQVVYMLQQPMSPSLGGLSSEELQAAAKMSQLGVYVPSVLTNLPAGAAALQPESQAAGLKNPDQQAAGQTAAGVPPSQGLPCSGAQPNANSLPAGLERAAPEAAIIPAPGRPKLKPARGNRF